jgi:hypothetical protein
VVLKALGSSIMLFLKGLCRFFSFTCLVVALLLGVLDSVRSVATQSIDLMSAHAVWELLSPQSLQFIASSVAHYLHPEAWRSMLVMLQDLPACAVALKLALVFWVVGYRKSRARPQGFAVVV